MQKITQKQLDNMLSRCFQEEARQVEVPSDKKLWADLQQRFDSAGMQQMEAKLAQLQQQIVPKEKQVFYKAGNVFWKKHKYLAGLVAACLVVFIISLQVAPSAGMNNFVHRFFTFMGTEMSSKSVLDDQNYGGEAQKMKIMDATQAEDANAKKELPIKAAERQAVPPSPAAGTVPGGNNETENYSLFVAESPDPNFSPQEEISGQEKDFYQDQGEEQGLKTGQEQEQVQSPGQGARQEQAGGQGFASKAVTEEIPQESVLYDQELFISKLNNLKHLAPEKIWRIGSLPEGFAFNEASVAETDTFLHSISQKYTNGESKIISLTQKFFPSKVPGDTELTTPDYLAHPIQVGPYNGCIIAEDEGFNTITWKQNNSIVTISGQLTEKKLFEVIDALKEF